MSDFIATKRLIITKVNIKESLDILFDLDVKVAKATPTYLPLETKKKFLDFFTKEHDAEILMCKEKNGTIAGFLALVSKLGEDSLEVLNIGIDPLYQHKGYGREMIEFAEKTALTSHTNHITLVTNKKNINAIGFFKHMGYSIIKEIPNYYGDGETRYLFGKTLSS